MKRALMTFGNPFGLALYDKDQSKGTEGMADDAHDTVSRHRVCFWPQSLSARSTGANSRPFAVSRYSARGGCCS